MDGLQVKEKMTIEELKERLNEICRENEWTGADIFLEYYFTDPDQILDNSRADVVRGFIYAMYYSGIITSKERDSFTNAMYGF